MRMLPDVNFKENYKKHYAENYEKLNAKREERAERRRSKPRDSLETIKYKVVGAAVTFIILGSFFAAGMFVSSSFSEKEQQIAEIEYNISQTEDLIRKYQVINSEETMQQLNDKLIFVTDLQNQYVTEQFSKSFASDAEYYLGSYNYDWSESVDKLSEPVWHGYANKACSFDETAELLFILYDGNRPVLLVFASCNIDQFGNIESLSSVRKTVLV